MIDPVLTAPVVTRFAPSPTGHLHLGHAYSALFAERAAREAGGRFLLRIEDIDRGRCRPEFEHAIYEDLAWLGLDWEQPVRRQSDHMAEYENALTRLDDLGVLYPCFCTRKDIAREIAAADGAPHLTQMGPDGPLYPGTCRHLSHQERADLKGAGEAFALRLDTTRALELVGELAGEIAGQTVGPLSWRDLDRGEIVAQPEIFGDVVLARKDTPTSYHLSVTLDDHIQGVNLVTRGEDLFAATHIHRLLQMLLGLNRPVYRHHGLLLGPEGQRLAKRDKAETLRAMREMGRTPAEVRALCGLGGENALTHPA